MTHPHFPPPSEIPTKSTPTPTFYWGVGWWWGGDEQAQLTRTLPPPRPWPCGELMERAFLAAALLARLWP